MASSSGISRRRAAAKAEASAPYRARRRELIAVAADVFRRQGLAGTSIDDVARAAGVDRATLYYYVGSKNELFEEVVVEALVANVELAERIRAADAPPDEKLGELVAAVIRSYADNFPHLFVFAQENAEHLPSIGSGHDIRGLQRRFDRAVIGLIEEGVARGVFRLDVSPRLAAYGIIGMVNWTHRWFHPDGAVGADAVGEAFARVAVEGLRRR
ncbi:MAG TPA: TetR/AcrR family transcriptional regulator [Baekduia sp.]|uniref:TetR/AcrR family transcriptional regulator n=1 Tax=Baekduia sp. TaxID=2600305 RepID=UPI002D79A57E|nr:TetR/AcrR family transcriptional regulator [Baekduia sp.]HET6509966.1 TetR/AcrR family transcriptional regulator [Baekduia sp.]